MKTKDHQVGDDTEFVPVRPSQRKAQTTKHNQPLLPSSMRRRTKWMWLIAITVVFLMAIATATLKLRADNTAQMYNKGGKAYLDAGQAVIAGYPTPKQTLDAFNKLEQPKFETVFLAEKYSEPYQHALKSKKIIESVRGGIAAKLTEYKLLAEFEERYQRELAAVAELHDSEPVSIDVAADWISQYQSRIAKMQETVRVSHVPEEVQPSKVALRNSLQSTSAALAEIAEATKLGRVEVYNKAFEKLTISENAMAEAYGRIQMVEPESAQTSLLTKITDAKKQL